MIYQGLFQNVYLRLKDWLNAVSQNIDDIALDLINRGQARLWSAADWEPLTETVVLTIVPAPAVTNGGGTALLPTDFGKVIFVYFDPVGYGKPIGFYGKDGSLIYGYKFLWDWDVVTGFGQPSLKFFFPSPWVPNLFYKKTLTDFTTGAIGDTSVPSFFPENLLLRAAQMEHLTDNLRDMNEYQVLEREYMKAIVDYKAQVQYVNPDWKNLVRDDSGNEVRVPAVDAIGGNNIPRPISPSLDNRWGL